MLKLHTVYLSFVYFVRAINFSTPCIPFDFSISIYLRPFYCQAGFPNNNLALQITIQ